MSVGCLAVSPKGTLLASGSSDRTIKLWELDTGKEIRTLTGHFGDVEAIAISPDGDILASGSDDTIRLWELKTGRELCRLDHHTGQAVRTFTNNSQTVLAVLFCPDGRTLVSSSADKTIKIWRSL